MSSALEGRWFVENITFLNKEKWNILDWSLSCIWNGKLLSLTRLCVNMIQELGYFRFAGYIWCLTDGAIESSNFPSWMTWGSKFDRGMTWLRVETMDSSLLRGWKEDKREKEQKRKRVAQSNLPAFAAVAIHRRVISI